MTDHSPSDPTEPPEPPDAGTTAAEDELVSAVLDREATEDEHAIVARDPRLRARLDAFAEVRDAVGDAPPVADATRNASIDAALAASPLPAPDERKGAPNPANLDVERAHRRRQIATILAAAAVVVIAVPLLAIALTGRGSEQKMAATGASANDSAEAVAGGDAAAAAPSSPTTPPGDSEALQAPESTFGSTAYAGDLGALTTPTQLRAEVEAALADSGRSLGYRSATPQSSTMARSQSPSFDAGGSTFDACGAALAADDPSLGSLVLTATASWNGEPAVVLVFRTVVPAEQTGAIADVIVLARPDCTTIGRFVA